MDADRKNLERYKIIMLQIKKCKICRREGDKLFLKGERCNSSKCSFNRRSYAPGKSEIKIHQKMSDYAKQLRAKQACKRIYKLSEKTLKNYYNKATKTKASTAERLLQLLELRLDNVVYRLGFAPSRSFSRQIVNHGHIKINNKKVNISSYLVKKSDKISVDNDFKPLVKNTKKHTDIPIWLKLNKDKVSGEIVKIPEKKDLDTKIGIQQILEFYSR